MGPHSWGRDGMHKHPEVSLFLKEAQEKWVGCTPGSGHDPGSTVSLLVLPDVIVLIIVKGLDVVTAAGLKQSCAGLRDPTCSTRLQEAQPSLPGWASNWEGQGSQGAVPLPHCPPPPCPCPPPMNTKLGTHTVLISVNAKVDLCNPVEWSAERTMQALSTWAGSITSRGNLLCACPSEPGWRLEGVCDPEHVVAERKARAPRPVQECGCQWGGAPSCAHLPSLQLWKEYLGGSHLAAVSALRVSGGCGGTLHLACPRVTPGSQLRK